MPGWILGGGWRNIWSASCVSRLLAFATILATNLRCHSRGRRETVWNAVVQVHPALRGISRALGADASIYCLVCAYSSGWLWRRAWGFPLGRSVSCALVDRGVAPPC